MQQFIQSNVGYDFTIQYNGYNTMRFTIETPTTFSYSIFNIYDYCPDVVKTEFTKQLENATSVEALHQILAGKIYKIVVYRGCITMDTILLSLGANLVTYKNCTTDGYVYRQYIKIGKYVCPKYDTIYSIFHQQCYYEQKIIELYASLHDIVDIDKLAVTVNIANVFRSG